MKADQTIEPIALEALLPRVLMLHHEGHRLVHIGATPVTEGFELNYGFDREGKYFTLRVAVPAAAPRVPSISRIYWAAFVYENEIHDLFNIQVEGMAVDFQGRFFKTSVAFPFAGDKTATAAKTSSVPGASFSVKTPAPAAPAAPAAPVAPNPAS